MRRIVLTFGLIAGGILSVMMVVTMPFMEQIGYDKGMVIGYTTMLAAYMLVYFGIRSYRESLPAGRISFGKAFQVGIMITLIACVCYVATWQFVYRKFVPDFMEKYSAYALETAQKKGATPAELEATRLQYADYTEKYKNPLYNIAFTFIEAFPLGLVITLVCAGLASRKTRDDVGHLAMRPGA